MHELNTGGNTSPLRTERVKRHWSQRELAERVGAGVTTVKRWERQETVPGPYFRLKLTALFGKSEEELGLSEASSLPTPPSVREATSKEQTKPVSNDTSLLWIVPSLRNPYFTGRDDLLCLLNEHFAVVDQNETPTTRRVASPRTLALTGLGGIGKTQIAVEYAYRMYELGTYTHTLWINAASEEAILTSFTSFAARLPGFAATNESDQQKLVDAITQWLEECPHRWLLIFDNADDLSLLQHYVPHHGNGSILLTTRAHAVGSLAASVAVEKMGTIEGTQLLLQRAQRRQQLSDEEVHAVDHLVVLLDYFPLALEQVGAYIEETGCTFDMYLHLYQTHRSTLLARRGAQATNYPDSVATTWALSFEKINQAHPAAAQLLQLCAFLAPDAIPEELLREGAKFWPVLLQQAVTNPFSFNQALEVLLSFSLVKRLAEDHLLRIHRLVQVIQLEMLTLDERRQWAERMVRGVDLLFPRQPIEDVSFSSQYLRYLESVQVCATVIEQQQMRFPEAADVLDRAGTYLRVHASYPLAEALYLQALHMREELWGTEHLEVASSLNNLGLLYWQQGRYDQAEGYYQQALHIRETFLGEQHPETATILNNLGILYWQQGKYELSLTSYQRGFEIRERLLGAHHLETARSLHGLGMLYYQLGQYEVAESYYVRSLTIKEKVLGEHYLETARTINNLGQIYSKQGKYELAESSYQRALAIKEGLLGTQHPETAGSLHNLGLLYYERGQYELAERYSYQALAIWEERVGERHPATAEILNSLGQVYSKQGKYELAESQYQRALAINQGLLGTQHPEIAKTLNNLAELYWTQREYEQAEPLFVRALDIQEHTLAANHPDLAKTLHDFARFHEGLGRLEVAASLFQRALRIREPVYGSQHPKTIETCERLQMVLYLLENEQKEV